LDATLISLVYDAGLRTAPQPVPATRACTLDEEALTPAAVRLMFKRTTRGAADDHLVGTDLDAAIAALSILSLRVGLTQDLFASGEDAGPIAQALCWTSTATARMLRSVRR
jgi:hypothetical protein